MSYRYQAAFAGLECSRKKQQRSVVALLFFPVLLYALALLPVDTPVFRIGPASAAETKERISHGKLIVVSPNSNIIIVDADHSGRQRIIGGRLAADASLVKNGKKVDLRYFRPGEYVKVHWRYTSIGKEVVSLTTLDAMPVERVSTTRSHGILRSSPPLAPRGEHVFHTSQIQPVIGRRASHIIGSQDTLLKIARRYSLGYNELIELYPQYDPWLPPQGKRLELPTERILPEARRQGIVINLAELRLYYFHRQNGIPMVTTYPVSIGTAEHQTPLGRYHIASKTIDPTWTVPTSLQHKYSFTSLPPGPDNPLGKYWLGLSIRAYGIHGTDIAYSVGRTITQGCIRMYPEDIERFFGVVELGTSVNLVYQPVKVAQMGNRVFIEVHRDVYDMHPSLAGLARKALNDKELWQKVDRDKLERALRNRSGIPVDITNSSLHASR